MAQRLVIILLCFVFVVETISPSANLAELSHAADIWIHFKEHQQEHPEITFFEFLSLHYLDSDHIKTKSQEHQKLPFSKRSLPSNASLQAVPDAPRIYTTPSRTLVMTIAAVIYSDGCTPAVAKAVWQPPKI
jgi:hypothetical protein